VTRGLGRLEKWDDRIATCHGVLLAAAILCCVGNGIALLWMKEHTEGGNRKEEEITQIKAIPIKADFCNIANKVEGKG
jgi:hypothetical protein